MTRLAVPDRPQDAALAPWWWAPGLTLGERLAAPDPPPGGAAPTGEDDLAALSRGGFAARLARLGLDEGAVAALRAEPPERLGGRAPRPPWAAFVERALAHERRERPGLAERPDDARVFVPVVRPLSDAAERELAERTRQLPGWAVDSAAVCAGTGEWIAVRLAEQAARTLVLELDRSRAAGRLDGEGPRERFDDFVARLATGRGLKALFARYPVLARLLAQTCLGAVAATAELLTRFAADRAVIVAELLGGRDPGALTGVEHGRGDPHQRGRSAAVLRFADGRAVLAKPRSLGQHRLLERLTAWLDAKVPGLGARTPLSVAGQGYGWIEFIEHRPCRTTAEVARFHRRQGGLMALLHAVDATDLHFENLIACGDQPVPVDAETLLHPTIPEAAITGPDPAAEALADSVHRTCVLPQLLIGEHGALDISAVGGRPGGTREGVTWDGAGTDRMRLVRGGVPFEGSQNRPLPGGATASPADFEAALLTGFRAAYDAIVAHRDELIGPGGLLTGQDDEPGRLIARASRLYATLLDESTHPEVLRDALARDAVFSVLWTDSAGDPVRQALIEAEILDLWAGDIPIFFHRPSGTEVRTSEGQRLPGLLAEPSLAAVRRKIAAMGEVDRHGQEWIISATLATGRQGAGPPHRGAAAALPQAPAVAPEPERFLAAACGIADEIVGRAIHGPDRANWLGLELVNDLHWTVLPMGAGLGQGYCGVALFLAQLGALTGASRYTDLAAKALTALPGLIASLAAEPELGRAVGPGAFHGLGGICWATARLATLLGDDARGALPSAVDALALAATAPDAPRGVTAGLAGALAAAGAVHAEHGLPSAAELAADLAARLARSAAEPQRAAAGPGFAHGDAGVGWALARHAPDRAAGAAGSALLGTALADAAAADAADEPATGWCEGAAGVLLAAADGGTAQRPNAQEHVGTLTGLLTRRPPRADLSPCHGELGTLEALAALATAGHEPAAAGYTRRAAAVLGSLGRHGHRCGTPGHLPSPGLLTGLSGIGYSLLRLGFPGTVPSVLLLEPGPHRSPAPHSRPVRPTSSQKWMPSS
ncbi:type 2 lanthipeptide synthetase LanM family protein [Streptomyces sp. PT12]|uniref:type 2 lanthipeptide synthetase LanM family protein n=1 Tax=Streptomyces sp. PT12 TaxID=1510197 RepID=UPI000DE33C7C|nr:type 2 lanthipeptide synthetase LanM family protein [Streptomyces sp. PT12]RBM20485.1 type 2 lantipeptide synthetase LanM [Streptomyces sp. PT12]